MIKLPEHKCGLYIEHNAYKSIYESIEAALEDLGDTISAKDYAECIKTGNLWIIRWYPDTAVGFYEVGGPTLERVLELANDKTS